MFSLISRIRRVFLRAWNLSIPYGLLLILCAYAVNRALNQYGQNVELAEAIRSISDVSILGYAMLLYIGYEMALKLRSRDMYECLSAYPDGINKAYRAMGVVLFVCILPYFFAATAGCVALYNIRNIPDPAFLANLLSSCVLYFFVLPLAGAAMGLAIAAFFKGKRIMAYLVFLLLLLITSGYLERAYYIPYNILGNKVGQPITNMLYRIGDWFVLTPFTFVERYMMDYLYAMPVEFPRWCLAFFWVSISVLVMFITIPGAQRKGRTFSILVALVGLCAAGYALRGDIPRLDQRPQSFFHYDSLHYMYTDADEIQPQVEALDGGFRIESIEGTLRVLNQLSARLTLTVTELDEKRDEYIFTLYHRYRISSVRVAGKKVAFAQEGDVFRVSRDALGQARELTVSYSGYSPRYYSNMQAILLPGYFPYYPMEGIKPVFRLFYGQGIDTGIAPGLRSFNIRLHSPLTAYSNLSVDDNHITGRAGAMTIFAGILKPFDKESRIYGSPMDEFSAERIGALIAPAYELLLNASQILEGKYRPQEDIRGLPVFSMPQIFLVSSLTERIVPLGDHLIIDAFSSGYAPLLAAHIFRQQVILPIDRLDLFNAFTQCLFDDQSFKALHEEDSKRSGQEHIQLLERIPRPTEEQFANQEFDTDIIDAALVYLIERDDNSGKRDTLSRIYDFLMAPAEKSEAQFLIELIEEGL